MKKLTKLATGAVGRWLAAANQVVLAKKAEEDVWRKRLATEATMALLAEVRLQTARVNLAKASAPSQRSASDVDFHGRIASIQKRVEKIEAATDPERIALAFKTSLAEYFPNPVDLKADASFFAPAVTNAKSFVLVDDEGEFVTIDDTERGKPNDGHRFCNYASTFADTSRFASEELALSYRATLDDCTSGSTAKVQQVALSPNVTSAEQFA